MTLSILVVDDRQDMRLLVSEYLLRLGHEVKVEPGGREAVAVLESGRRFDAVFTDLRMPSVGGEVVLRTARRRLPNAKLILMTASDLHPALVRVIRAAGADEIMEKPFSMEGLETILARLFP